MSVAEVVELVRSGTRLVTLTGPGGSGKTRLAIEVCRRAAGATSRQGCFWIGLAALRDPALVVETIAQTLGAKEALADHIGERELLLVLDNFEQVVDAAPELADAGRGVSQPGLAGHQPRAVACSRRGRVPGAAAGRAGGGRAVLRACAARAGRGDRGTLPPAGRRCRSRSSSPPRGRACLRQRRSSSGWHSGSTCSRAAATPTRASKRCGRRSSGRTTCCRPTSKQLFARLAVFAGGCTLAAAEEVVRRGPRQPSIARREEPPPAHRRPLLDARDDP